MVKNQEKQKNVFIHQIKISKEVYSKLSPRMQGYASYMQAAFNKEIPKKNPYKRITKEFSQWNKGSVLAYEEILCWDDEG